MDTKWLRAARIRSLQPKISWCSCCVPLSARSSRASGPWAHSPCCKRPQAEVPLTNLTHRFVGCAATLLHDVCCVLRTMDGVVNRVRTSSTICTPIEPLTVTRIKFPRHAPSDLLSGNRPCTIAILVVRTLAPVSLVGLAEPRRAWHRLCPDPRRRPSPVLLHVLRSLPKNISASAVASLSPPLFKSPAPPPPPIVAGPLGRRVTSSLD